MRKNKKNAFTLIELLAVIVILAIIALIATPIILGIVEDARKDSFMRSVELVVGTTDIDIFSKDYKNNYTYTIKDGVVSNLEVGVKNTDGMNGSITYDKNGLEQYAIHNGKYCVIKTSGMKKAEIKDYVEGECQLSNATDASYFTYDYLEIEDVEIVDKDACVEFHITEWEYDEDEAISICNNEPYDGMTLTEWLASEYASQDVIDELKEVGAIEFTAKEIEITGYSEEGPKDIIIPDEIDGYKVVSIGSFAFSNMSLTSVVLPDTIINIGHSAFSTNLLTEITLPSSLEEIDDYAFCYNNLSQASVDNIEDINEYAYCNVTDGNCFTYEDTTITTGYEIVNANACAEYLADEYNFDETRATSLCNNERVNGMTLIEQIVSGYAPEEVADGLKEVGVIEEIEVSGIQITGYQCPATDIVIPNKINNKEVLSIGSDAFLRYSNGIITSIVTPDTLIYIGDDAFYDNQINRLKLSSNLSHIDTNAFYDNNIQKLVIPKKVGKMGSSAFGENSLQEIVFTNSFIIVQENYVFCNNPIKSHPQIRSNAFTCPPK